MPDEQTLTTLVEKLAQERGLDLRGYKTSTLERRIRRRMTQVGTRSFDEYLQYIRNSPSEPTELLNAVLINVTRFFRDSQAWNVVAREVLPGLFLDRRPGETFRVWCAGCATGEEAYSVAILLFELLGNRVREFDIKIYATDNDEHALSIARKAEYPQEALRGVPADVQARYFTGHDLLKVVREVRRLVIFGRSNILSDAPISHVDLLVCRNLLIYFDPAAQAQIMAHFRYALNEGGVLFLGKSESQLKRDSGFTPINARWRIFRRRVKREESERFDNFPEKSMEPTDKPHQELERLKLFYETILDTLEPGVLVLDAADTVITENEKALALWGISSKLGGRNLADTELWDRCPELRERLAESRRQGPKTVRFECNASPTMALSVTIRPIMAGSGTGQVGTLVYMENVTSRVTLQTTIEELETTGEELQSSNEELETTNEELQSTNEELETTNEELQSTNEELETTNEELQSLNEELETTNEELSSRTRELDELNARYLEMIERMPWPVFLINRDSQIFMFNSAAQKLFGFARPSAQGMSLEQLPLDTRTRQAMQRRHRQVLQTEKESSIRNWRMTTNRFEGVADVTFTPLSAAGSGQGVIVMFEVRRPAGNLSANSSRNRGKQLSGTTKPKNSARRSKKKSSKK